MGGAEEAVAKAGSFPYTKKYDLQVIDLVLLSPLRSHPTGLILYAEWRCIASPADLNYHAMQQRLQLLLQNTR